MSYHQERWAFDFEVLKNFACCTFVHVETKETKVFIFWKKQDDTYDLLDFLGTDPFLISYNGISYDMPILRFIRDYQGSSLNKELYNLSGRLISDHSFDDDQVKKLRYPFGEDYVHQDLMTMLNFHRTKVGLKQCAINLKWHKIQDMPIEHTTTITENLIPEILSYNLNDCLITIELYNNKDVTQARELREALVAEFGNRVLSASKSKLANIFLEAMYEKETGIPKKVFKEGRTPRGEIKLSTVILPSVHFKSQELKELKEQLLTMSVTSSDKFNIPLKFKGNVYNLRKGGLHTKENPAFYRGSDDLKIISMDVASFYPAIMCEYRIKPEHMRDEYLDILTRVKSERIAAKKSGDKIKAESYKILINSIFGKSGDPLYFLYDELALYRVTLNGQLFLLMLVERMEDSGIHVLSANTDGIEVLVPKSLEDAAMKIAKEWEQETRFELEFVYYSLYAKRDVNSYIAVSTDGKKKTKGAFLDTVDLEKGYQHPIVAKAINEYLVNGVSAEETIGNCKSIMDFCVSKKSDSKFKIEYQTIDGTKELQKTNRFYVSNKGGRLVKRERSTGKTTGIFVGQSVQILNDYDSSIPFDELDVNVRWYVKQAQKMIDAIDPKVVQQSLFDGMTVDWGSKTKMSCPSVPLVKKEQKVKTKDILEANRTRRTFPVSARYALVVGVDTKYSPSVKFYSLSKGSEQNFKISKKLFEKIPLSVGDVVHLDGFEEKPKMMKEGDGFVEVPDQKQWWVTGYHTISDATSILQNIS